MLGINKLHFGPGPNWIKPDNTWATIDVDPRRGDIIADFNAFTSLPFDDRSVVCIYGSHVFEHIDIFNCPRVFRECCRVLTEGGVFRLVLPDVRKSIEEYLKGNWEFGLFQRRRRALEQLMGHKEVALFDLLRGDFLSPSGQPDLLGKESMAHQNAWDFDSLRLDLERAGFPRLGIRQMTYRQSQSSHLTFEGTYQSEADEWDRSLYVEAVK